jgi:aarF domain-containing kinase
MYSSHRGLYIKFGQGIASMNHVLPPQYNSTFKVLQDQAPCIPFDKVNDIFKEEFGASPAQVFKSFDQVPIASASIAQVHRAELHDGTPVAVKVQKHFVRPQFFWDMLAYKIVTRVFECLFQLPLTWSIDYIEKHMKEECDFLKEAQNSERTYQDILKQREFSRDLYVPKVFKEFTTSRILTAEWIDGMKITDRDKLERAGYSVQHIMSKVVSFFSYQIFQTGFLHCK